jgi:hypothetical protein
MDDKFRAAQRAYDNMSPPEERLPDHRYTNWPCDRCGSTRIEIVVNEEDGYIPYCDKCNNRVTNNQGRGWDLDDEAEEAWEKEMERLHQEDLEDKKNKNE